MTWAVDSLLVPARWCACTGKSVAGNELLGHQLPNGLLNVSCALSKGFAIDPAC